MKRRTILAMLVLLFVAPATVSAQHSIVVRGGQKVEVPWDGMTDSINSNESVIFGFRNGTVETVAIVKVNDPNRRIDDVVIAARGYRLPQATHQK